MCPFLQIELKSRTSPKRVAAGNSQVEAGGCTKTPFSSLRVETTQSRGGDMAADVDFSIQFSILISREKDFALFSIQMLCPQVE